VFVLDPQVLDPRPGRCVPKVKPGPLYEILDANGRSSTGRADGDAPRDVDPAAGALRGISPLEKLRRSIGRRHRRRGLRRPVLRTGRGAVVRRRGPGRWTRRSSTPPRVAAAKYAGLRNSHAIGVLTDGGKFVTGLAPTPEQAQMLETRKFSVEDSAARTACRPHGR
jgi:hypothetical protein